MTDLEVPRIVGPRRFRNSTAMLQDANPAWQAAADRGLTGIDVHPESNNRLVAADTGHSFVNMVSCAYLGLNSHPAVIEGAVQALRDNGITDLGVSPTRIRPTLHTRLEDELSDLFGAHVLVVSTCSAATAGVLPLVASGHLAPGGPRVMVFDRNSHFSMSYVKAICAEESLVLTCGHNDLDFVADACRRYGNVAFVGDGAYSMGGAAHLEGLLELQDRYGLYLYLDDSHSLSIVGNHGEGFVRSRTEVNELTTVVTSLCKGFGSGGGAVLVDSARKVEFLGRHGGPIVWSQNVPLPTLGAALASAAIHRSAELGELQAKLWANLAYYDELLPSPLAGNGLPVRRVDLGEVDRAVAMSAELYRRGFYSSAVFFPIVPKGAAGLRVMVRADMERDEIAAFAGHLTELTA